MPKYIITGGPGAGKTSLLDGLRQCRYPCYAEASRRLIIEEKDTDCLPWINLSCFAKKVLQRMTDDFRCAAPTGDIFFDRGIPDIIAYLQAAGLPVGDDYHRAAEECRYADTVFLLPPGVIFMYRTAKDGRLLKRRWYWTNTYGWLIEAIISWSCRAAPYRRGSRLFKNKYNEQAF